MEAPEKVYIDDFGSGFSHGWHTEHSYEKDIEYIRKDIFIEKACKFFEPYIPDNSGGYDRVLVLENFKKYMEGE